VVSILTRLEVIRDTREWLRVRLPDGREAWLQKGDTRPVFRGPGPAGKLRAGEQAGARTAPDAQAVAATALRFLGLPYLWGGTTTFGLDCSGLAQLAYRLHRFLLPRDADLQYADPRLESVPRAKVRAGDLIFFGPGTRGITHVGIALGSDSFVSATTYECPMVRIDRLKDPYWKRLYRGARRVPR
jgi:gamma-D-glutamyl-L-lysine dipeptidyl-peptidase